MVMGIMMRPADARAMAPVVRFARFESCGSEDDDDAGRAQAVGFVVCDETAPVERSRLDWKTCWRRALRVEK